MANRIAIFCVNDHHHELAQERTLPNDAISPLTMALASVSSLLETSRCAIFL